MKRTVPKALVLALSVGLLCLPAALAAAGIYRVNGSDLIQHRHQVIYNVHVPDWGGSNFETASSAARADWRVKLDSATKESITPGNSTLADADIKFAKSPMGDNNVAYVIPAAGSGVHPGSTPATIQLNSDAAFNGMLQGYACQAIGQIFTLEVAGSGRGDCMGGTPPAAQTVGLNASMPYVDKFFGPNVTNVSGTLFSWRTDLNPQTSYTLNMTAEGHALTAIRLYLDGASQPFASQVPAQPFCNSGATQPTGAQPTCKIVWSTNVTTTAANLPPGDHTLDIKAINEFGKSRTYTLPLHVNPMWGFNDDFQLRGGTAANGDPIADLHEEIPKTAAAGAQLIRMAVRWRVVEQTEGTYDFNRPGQPFLSNYNDMLAAGLKPIIVLMGAPDWADGTPVGSNPSGCPYTSGCEYPPGSGYYDEFADFVYQAAITFPNAYAFEIWNEPNSPKYWGPTPSAANYATMVQLSSGAIQNAEATLGKNITWITGGLADDAGSAPIIPQHTFVANMLASPNLTSIGFDGVGIHPYPRPDTSLCTSPSASDVDYMECKLKQVRLALNQVPAASNLPLWVTETGKSSTGDQTTIPSMHYAAGTDSDGAAVAADDDDVAAFVIHRWRDNGNDTYGVVGPFPDYAPKSSLCYITIFMGTKASC